MMTRSRAQLTHTDHANVRSVCKDLQGAMHRLFFSVLVLRIGEQLQSDDGMQMLTALANGGTGWSLHAKTLRITPGNQAGRQEAEEWDMLHSDMRDLLAYALDSMPNIRTVA